MHVPGPSKYTYDVLYLTCRLLVDFSNTLPKADLERLAEVDEHEVVREVQEYFGDYLAINPDLFSLGMKDLLIDSSAYEQAIHGLSSVLLSLKKKPAIRYAAGSTVAKRLAYELQVCQSRCPVTR